MNDSVSTSTSSSSAATSAGRGLWSYLVSSPHLRWLLIACIVLTAFSHVSLIWKLRHTSQDIQNQQARLVQGTAALHNFALRLDTWYERTHRRFLWLLEGQGDVIKPDWDSGRALMQRHILNLAEGMENIEDLKSIWADALVWRQNYDQLYHQDIKQKSNEHVQQYMQRHHKLETQRTGLLKRLSWIYQHRAEQRVQIAQRAQNERQTLLNSHAEALDVLWQHSAWLAMLSALLSICSLALALAWFAQRFQKPKTNTKASGAHSKPAYLQHVEFIALNNLCQSLSPALKCIDHNTQRLLKASRNRNNAAYQAIEQIHNSNQYAQQLLEDVEDLSYLENHQLKLKLCNVNLPSLIEQLKPDVEAWAQASGNTVLWHCSADTQEIFTDPDKLKQILLQLLENACHFTEQGQVVFCIRRDNPLPSEHNFVDSDVPIDTKTGEPTKHLIFEIADDGAGISLEQQEQLLKLFHAAQTAPEEAETDTASVWDMQSFEHKDRNLGLGLVLVHQLTRCLGGELSLISSPGHGSVFSVSLPQKLPHPEKHVTAFETPAAATSTQDSDGMPLNDTHAEKQCLDSMCKVS